MALLKQIDYFLAKIEEIVLVSCIITMVAILGINVVLRFSFSTSFVFAEEVALILLTAITFIGLSYVARHGKHIRMDMFYDHVSERCKKTLILIISSITGLTLYYLSYLSLIYFWSIKVSNRLTPVLHIPVHLITFVVVLGFFMAATQYIRIFYMNLKSCEALIGTYPGAEHKGF